MGIPRDPTGPVPQGSPPTDAEASAGPSPTGHPSGPSPSLRRGRSKADPKAAAAAWSDLRTAVGGEEIKPESASDADVVEGREDADPELIEEAQRIADEALAEAKAAEAAAVAEAAALDLADKVEEAEEAAVVIEDITQLAAERDDYLDQLRRISADFDNYRKRMLKQQTEHVERAAEDLVAKLLDVLDTFDMALSHGEGYEQVHSRLMDVLAKEGLERIDPVDEPFDPNVADAVAHEDADDGPVVAAVLRAGYRWKGRVIRPAMVKVRG